MLSCQAGPRPRDLADPPGIKFIFYPCVPYERNETPDAQNHYNCPIVTSYAENIKNNVEELAEENVRLLNPFMAFTDEKILEDRLAEVFTKEENIPEEEVRAAAKKAWRSFWPAAAILKRRARRP